MAPGTWRWWRDCRDTGGGQGAIREWAEWTEWWWSRARRRVAGLGGDEILEPAGRRRSRGGMTATGRRDAGDPGSAGVSPARGILVSPGAPASRRLGEFWRARERRRLAGSDLHESPPLASDSGLLPALGGGAATSFVFTPTGHGGVIAAHQLFRWLQAAKLARPSPAGMVEAALCIGEGVFDGAVGIA